MAQSEAIKLAKIKARQQVASDTLALVKASLSNPIVELIGGFVLVETLQRFPASRPIIGNLQGDMIEGGIAGIIAVQQLAPSLPYIVQAGEGMTKLLGNMLPLLSLAGV